MENSLQSFNFTPNKITRVITDDTCVDHLLFTDGSIKKVREELHYKSIEEMEDLFFLSKGDVCHA